MCGHSVRYLSNSASFIILLFGLGFNNVCTCIAGHTSTVWGLSTNEDGNCAVSCSDDKSVILWEEVSAVDCLFVMNEVDLPVSCTCV